VNNFSVFANWRNRNFLLEGGRGGRQMEVCAPGAKNPSYASAKKSFTWRISDSLRTSWNLTWKSTLGTSQQAHSQLARYTSARQYTLNTTRTIKNRYRFFELTLRRYRYAFFKESTSARFLRRTDVMSVLQKNVSILRKNRRQVGFSENVPILCKNRLWNGTSSYETR